MKKLILILIAAHVAVVACFSEGRSANGKPGLMNKPAAVALDTTHPSFSFINKTQANADVPADSKSYATN